MSGWIAVIIAGIGTYLMRASFITFWAEKDLPESVARSLRYVAPAAFAGIVAPAVLGDNGLGTFVAPDARLIAAAIAFVFVWKVRSVPAALVVGMVSLWLLQWAGL